MAPANRRAAGQAGEAPPVDFFRLWLDPELVTGCAWFEAGGEALDRAQVSGLRRICRLLDLRRGHVVLDVSGGYGAFARLAAREFGARVLALVQSGEELEHARHRLRAEGLHSRVGVELLAGFTPAQASFDRVVSLNLLAATDFPLASNVLSAALRADGRFVGHFVLPARQGEGLRSSGPRQDMARRPAFSLPDMAEAEQRLCAAGFAIAGRRRLRLPLELTLEHWRRNLERHLPQALRLQPDARLADWRLQLAAAVEALRQGRLQLQELVAGKREPRRQERKAGSVRTDLQDGGTDQAAFAQVSQCAVGVGQGI